MMTMTAQGQTPHGPKHEPADQTHQLKVLVSAASAHGSTAEIASAIGEVLTKHGLRATVIPPAEVGSVADYDAVILGSAVYTGHWLAAAKDLVARSRDALAGRPVWLFSSGPVGDPSRKLVQSMGKDPADLAAIQAATHHAGTGCSPASLIRRS
jgi:menaquinone-dependent protoporphyrinogen oxidase